MSKRLLVACEESQAVTKAFRYFGIEAYSCDLQPCSGGEEDWHIQDDVTRVLKDHWDAVIAFPPCTHLCISGAKHFAVKKYDGRQQEGIDFFLLFTRLSVPLVAIENPVGIMSNIYRKPDQIIHPWQFGHSESKSTCLWLKGFPKLKPTKIVDKGEFRVLPDGKRIPLILSDIVDRENRGKIRSKTYQGIADAMAIQWVDTIDPY